MGKLAVSRASTAVAVVAAIVAVLAVMAFPGVSIGDPTLIPGGSPSNVIMNTDPLICADADVGGTNAMPTAVSLEDEAHLLAQI